MQGCVPDAVGQRNQNVGVVEQRGLLQDQARKTFGVSSEIPPTPQRVSPKHFLSQVRWRRKWQPTPVFLLGESQGQRSLTGYSPWGHKESDMTQ